ncbi:MAG: hypothetical protein KatS3mg039_0385 [Candidatus Kapaibacterium sp.]|nr:MAG: hypothetical protein KatS3mg039_0385 [Candidatus Kapabacteria bacterium]
MYILKFGGTSVAGAAQIAAVADIVAQAAATTPVLVVVSAFRGVTDMLLHMARSAATGQDWQSLWQQVADRHRQTAEELSLGPCTELEELLEDLHRFCTGIALLGECTTRMLDHVAAYGELLSSRLLVAHCTHRGEDAIWHDVRSVIITDASFTSAAVDWERTIAAARAHLQPLLATHRIVVTQGFIGSTPTGTTTTLGRGGSDYSAAILGACLHADRIEIWTDVSGIFSADPRRIPDAQSLPTVTLGEVAALAAYGARVLHPRTIEPAIEQAIPVVVRNTFEPTHPGTEIVPELPSPIGGIRAITMLDAYASTQPTAGHCQGLLAAVELQGYTRHLYRECFDERAQPVTLVCCVGAWLHHRGTALQQIAEATCSLGCTVDVVASTPQSILFTVDRSVGQQMLEALHQKIVTVAVEAIP